MVLRRKQAWPWLLVVLLAGCLPLMAGEVEIEMDPDNPDPDDGKEAGDKWNPTYTCVSEEGDTVGELLLCLSGGISGSAGACIPAPTAYIPSEPGELTTLPGDPVGDCTAAPQVREDWDLFWFAEPRHGYVIRPVYGNAADEVTRLVLWENHDSIQAARLLVDQPRLVARIANFTEKPNPSGNYTVSVTIDGSTATVDLAPLKHAHEVTGELVYQLGLLGFDVAQTGSFILVMDDFDAEDGVTEIRIHSDDPRIVTTDIALVPIEEVSDLLGQQSQ